MARPKKTVVNAMTNAEALNQITSLPEIAESKDILKEHDPVSTTPDAFRMAVGRAQMDGIDYVEVSDELFKFLVKNQPTNYLTYGDPGIKVFKQGTREQILKEESMNAEDFAYMLSRRKMAALGQA